MKDRQQIRFAFFGSILTHVLLAGGVTTILAFNRASPPGNDDFENARALYSGEVRSGFGDNYYATSELYEPEHGQSSTGGSVWWSWDAPQSGEAELGVMTQDFEAVVGVYRGAVLQTLVEVAARQPGTTDPLRFSVQAGHSYYVAVAGVEERQEGKIAVSISMIDDDLSQEEEEQHVLLLPEMFEVEEVNEDDSDEERAYVRTKSSDSPEKAPEDTRLESDNNTVAASELLPGEKGNDNVPNIAGEDLPFGELEASEFVDGDFRNEEPLSVSQNQNVRDELAPKISDLGEQSPAEALALPEVKQHTKNGDVVRDVEREERIEDDATLLEVAGTDPEQVVKENQNGDVEEVSNELKHEETVSEKVPAEFAVNEMQQKEVSPPGFRTHAAKKRLEGRLSNLGNAALDVAETPLGHYKKKVDLAVQRSWHRARIARGDFAKFGSLKVRFWVDRSGKIVELKVVRNNADPVMLDFSISGIRNAVLPPVPEELINRTQDERMEFDYEIIIY